MKSLEISGKTVEEALQSALERLGARREEVKVTVLKRSRHGIFGLGAEEAVIRVEKVTKEPKEEPVSPEGDNATSLAIGVIEKLVALMGISASIVPDSNFLTENAPEEKSIVLNIKGQDLGILIGRRGQTLASFQFVTRLILARLLGEQISVNLDIEGYKKRRYESLESLALRLAEQVRTTKVPFTLEPMPPDERRVIHLALASQPQVTTKSIGVGNERKVMILPT